MNQYENKYDRLSAILGCLDSGSETPLSISKKLSIPLDQLRRDLMFIFSSPLFRSCYIPLSEDEPDFSRLVTAIDERKEGWENFTLYFSRPFESEMGHMIFITPIERSLFYDTVKKHNTDPEMITIRRNPAYSGQEKGKNFEIMQSCIDYEKDAEVIYMSPKYGLMTFLIHPAKVLYSTDNGHCYFICFGNGQELIMLRLDRIRNVHMLKTDRPFSMTEKERKQLACFDYIWGADTSYEQKDPADVCIRIKNPTKNMLEKIRNDTSRRKYGHLEKSKSETDVYYYTDKVIGMSSFRRWILLFGKSMTVLEPRELAESIRESAQRKLDLYKAGSFDRQTKNKRV